MDQKNVIEIQKEVRVGEIILEKGDKIKIFPKVKENYNHSKVNKVLINFINGLFKKYEVRDDASKYIFAQDGMICISAEDEHSYLIADYYGEFKNNLPYINPELERTLEKMGLYAEWLNPGAICIGEM
ncbi:MAG: hypothetical protein ACOC3V_00455 [bacterium]